MLYNGFLSIISKNGGITGLTPPYSFRDVTLLSSDPNTVFIGYQSREKFKKIYFAINDICYQLERSTAKGNPYRGIKGVYEDQYDDYQSIGRVRSLDGMNGHEFEYFCAELLRENGFTDVSVTPGSGDQGVDILAQKDGVLSGKLNEAPIGRLFATT